MELSNLIGERTTIQIFVYYLISPTQRSWFFIVGTIKSLVVASHSYPLPTCSNLMDISYKHLKSLDLLFPIVKWVWSII